MREHSWLRGLNPEQRSAVTHTDGPLLVLAGAGSGKTKTLVHRVVHLIRGQKVEPSRILVVTFTNKAADEMRERVRAYAGEDAAGVIVSTFHSLGLRILRWHGEKLGLPRRFAIYAAADQLGALRQATEEIHIADDRFDLKRVLSRISHWKTRRVTPDEARRQVAEEPGGGTRADEYEVLAADAYGRYEDTLRACGAVDFDDLLLLPVQLLEQDEEVRRDVWRRWHYLMVDEYQDTNAVQLHMTRLLAGARRNVCVVGDDDQSIYAFRGADVGNILDFERHFEGTSVIRLEQNYRSTKRILEVANAIIAGNAHRHPKRLRTDNPIGAPVPLYEHDDDAAEAERVAAEISVRRFRERRAWRDFAVLYRANTQARPLEEVFRAKGIPYRVVGGTSFFDRKEVADALAYLRVMVHPRDEIALRRIINVPTRGIGRTTVTRVADRARGDGAPFAKALATVSDDDVGAPQAASVRQFLGLLDARRHALRAAEQAARHPPPATGMPPIARWALELFREVGLEDMIRADRRANNAEARIGNLRDLAGTLARYERRRWAEAADRVEDGGPAALVLTAESGADDAGDDAWRPPTLADALARLALADLDDPDADQDEADADVVTLMTLHSAKGLEFDDVFLVGLEEGILPHARSLDDGEGDALAEERRLLYVGVTRAKRRLTLSHCRTRRRGGDVVDVLPSRYLDDIPEGLLDIRTAESVLSPEESKDLRENFFRNMKEMLDG
ncbi:MAG: UvrD-helicase domain-containing protein [Gemmatimonadota bacterium]